MTTSDHISAEHVERVRRYLTALLPPEAAQAALREALDQARYWRDTELVDVLGHAHASLRSRADVPARTEAAVLIVEARVDPATAAEIAGVDVDVAERAAADHRQRSTAGVEFDSDASDEDRRDPLELAHRDPVASPTGEPTARPTSDRVRLRLPRAWREPQPPEAIGEELRRHLRREDLETNRYSPRVRLILVGIALGLFLLFLASVAASGLIA